MEDHHTYKNYNYQYMYLVVEVTRYWNSSPVRVRKIDKFL